MDSWEQVDSVLGGPSSRRKFLLASGAAGTMSLAGCSGSPSGSENNTEGERGTPSATTGGDQGSDQTDGDQNTDTGNTTYTTIDALESLPLLSRHSNNIPQIRIWEPSKIHQNLEKSRAESYAEMWKDNRDPYIGRLVEPQNLDVSLASIEKRPRPAVAYMGLGHQSDPEAVLAENGIEDTGESIGEFNIWKGLFPEYDEEGVADTIFAVSSDKVLATLSYIEDTSSQDFAEEIIRAQNGEVSNYTDSEGLEPHIDRIGGFSSFIWDSYSLYHRFYDDNASRATLEKMTEEHGSMKRSFEDSDTIEEVFYLSTEEGYKEFRFEEPREELFG